MLHRQRSNEDAGAYNPGDVQRVRPDDVTDAQIGRPLDGGNHSGHVLRKGRAYGNQRERHDQLRHPEPSREDGTVLNEKKASAGHAEPA